MQEQPTRNWTPLEDLRVTASILAVAVAAVAAPVEPFLRTRFGSHYFGVPSVLGLLIVPLWTSFWPSEDPRPVLWFWGLYVVMQLRARVEQCVRSVRGDRGHSRYNGKPLLSLFFRRMPESRIKGGVEPVVVMTAGLLFITTSEPLASYLIVAGFCLSITAGLIEWREKARMRQLRDAWIEQEQLAARFREMMRDRR